MKTINLKSLINIYTFNQNTLPKEYINFIGEDYGLEVKRGELDVLKSLLQYIESNEFNFSLKELSYFYLGYKIPQIGKEFDLLRFEEKRVLNIEYKKEVKNIDVLKEQLIRNKYYLQFLNKEIILIGYIQAENEIYKLENDQLLKISVYELIDILTLGDKYIETDLNMLFKVSNYLISPFNKTEQFMHEQYFLTTHQEEIRKNILNSIKNGEKYFLIQGGAGTGKTLLVYNIANFLLKQNEKVALIHCGNLNEGQIKLNEKYGWHIFPAKGYLFTLSGEYNVIIIDEVQRIKINQFISIKKYVEENNVTLILSGDERQILKNGEEGILQAIDNKEFKIFSLTKKIRTNKELANFISIIFDLDKLNSKKIEKKNINVTFFNSYNDANEYILSKKSFSFIPYTSTLYPENGTVGFEMMENNKNAVGNPHKVIGQEFTSVGVMIDKHFYYENNKLKARSMNNNVYSPKYMFYQAITRVIDTLEIIVVENIDVFNVLINLFDNK